MMRASLGLLFAAVAAPAHAEVISSGENGFVIEAAAKSALNPESVWTRLVQPSLWWSSAHSWSGNAANMSIDPRAGGCFCERWEGGSAEHGRVIHSVDGKMLRISAPLGPLQAMAVNGVLTFELEPAKAGTMIRMRFIVGGNFGMDARSIAPAVDGVLRKQLELLAQTSAS